MTSAPFNGISCVPASAAFAVHGYHAHDEFLFDFSPSRDPEPPQREHFPVPSHSRQGRVWDRTVWMLPAPLQRWHLPEPRQNGQTFVREAKFVPRVGPAQGGESIRSLCLERGEVNGYGRDLFLAKRFARHVSPLTTTVYTHPGDEELFEGIRSLPC